MDPMRWWVLFLFVLVSTINAMVAMTFSSMPTETKEIYPGIDDEQVEFVFSLT